MINNLKEKICENTLPDLLDQELFYEEHLFISLKRLLRDHLHIASTSHTFHPPLTTHTLHPRSTTHLPFQRLSYQQHLKNNHLPTTPHCQPSITSTDVMANAKITAGTHHQQVKTALPVSSKTNSGAMHEVNGSGLVNARAQIGQRQPTSQQNPGGSRKRSLEEDDHEAENPAKRPRQGQRVDETHPAAKASVAASALANKASIGPKAQGAQTGTRRVKVHGKKWKIENENDMLISRQSSIWSRKNKALEEKRKRELLGPVSPPGSKVTKPSLPPKQLPGKVEKLESGKKPYQVRRPLLHFFLFLTTGASNLHSLCTRL